MCALKMKGLIQVVVQAHCDFKCSLSVVHAAFPWSKAVPSEMEAYSGFSGIE